MKRCFAITIFLLGSVVASVAPAGPVAGAQVGVCPEMTDSVQRLYSAYFLRNPDQGGFAFWVDEYSSGNRNIRQISQAFEQSPEFIQTYGSLNNEEFVELVYQNVLDRDPDAGGAAFWKGELDGGYPRGAMMIGFSESKEYVEKTVTVRSLAGYGRIYPVGTTWHCGKGGAEFSIDRPRSAQRFDVLGVNANDADARVVVDTVNGSGQAIIRLFDFTIQPDGFVLSWPIAANPATAFGADTRQLRITAPDTESHWTVVFYPTAIAADRPGWDDPAGTPDFLR